MGPAECPHGHLARVCEVCERDGEIAALRSLLAQREAALRKIAAVPISTAPVITQEMQQMHGIAVRGLEAK